MIYFVVGFIVGLLVGVGAILVWAFERFGDLW